MGIWVWFGKNLDGGVSWVKEDIVGDNAQGHKTAEPVGGIYKSVISDHEEGRKEVGWRACRLEGEQRP